MTLKSFKVALAAAAASVSFAIFTPSTASAGTLDLSAYGWYASFDDNIDLTILSTSNNGIVVSLEKFADFKNGVTSTGVIQPLNIVFRQVSKNAVSQIAIEDESVLNDTGSTWGGFRFILEGGLGATKPTFDASSSGFSTDPFTTKVLSDKELTVTGGSLGSGSFPGNLWTPGATGALTINAAPITSGSLAQTFVFKEQPILIPLPAAAWTSLSGLVAVGLLAGAKQARRILA